MDEDELAAEAARDEFQDNELRFGDWNEPPRVEWPPLPASLTCNHHAN